MPEPMPFVTGLQAITLAHHAHLTQRVGPISSEDVARHMPTARAIHAANLEAHPHPIDASLPPDAHEWAAQRIACNLVALERGYSIERAIRAQERAFTASQESSRRSSGPHPGLRPMPTTAGD